jgi:signal transduction histidine kinase
MRPITLFIVFLLCFSVLKSQSIQTIPDSSYVEILKKINDRITQSSEKEDWANLALAYYDRARCNFYVPLRNQDIIGDLIESAKLYKYLKDDLGFYNARLALAEFYILEEIFLDDALKLTAESFRFYNEKGIKKKVINATYQLGRIYKKKLDYEKAIPYVEKALAGSIEIGDHQGELESRLLIIELFGKLGNVERVIEQGLYSIELEKTYGLNIVSAQIYHLMASNLYKDGQLKRAFEYAQQSAELNPKKNSLSEQNFTLLASLYKEQGEPESAYEHALLATNIKTELYNQEKYALSNQLAVKYQTFEKEKEIKELEQDNELIEFRLTQRTRVFIILLSLFSLIAAGAFYLYRLQRQKLAIKNLIAQQQEEISKQKINELENSLNIKNLKAMVKGQEAERTRIATDLHDSLGGMLSTLKLQYDTLQLDHKELAQDADYYKVMDLIDEACKDVRDIARNLKPNALEKMGLEPALKDLINRYSLRGTMDISLHTSQVDNLLSEDAKLHVYRIIQELLNNALKHAHATEIDVQINNYDDELVIVVEDNGSGFNQETVTKGLGLGNLESRVNLLRGEMEIDTSPNKGTSVMVHIPIATAATSSLD